MLKKSKKQHRSLVVSGFFSIPCDFNCREQLGSAPCHKKRSFTLKTMRFQSANELGTFVTHTKVPWLG